MNPRTLLALTLLTASPLSAHAQAAPAAPAPSAPNAQSITLRYKFTPGQIHRFKFHIDMDGLMPSPAGGAGTPLQMTMQMTMRQTVKNVRASDGAATISSQIEDAHTVVNGKETALPQAQLDQMKKPSTMVMLPSGKILSFDMPAIGGAGLPGTDFSQGMFNSTAALPDGPVRVGDTWKGSAGMPVAGTKMTFTSTLNSLSQTKPSLATIGQQQAGVIDMTLSQGMPVAMKMTGTVKGSGTQVFDADAGALVSTTGTASTDMTMTFGKPADGSALPPGMPAAMNVQMKTTITMQRLDGMAQTVAPAAP